MDISVVIPTYNRLAKLKRCLARLEAQTLSMDRFEVCVISDGSSDGTEDFLKQYKEKAPFVFTFFVQQNKGAGAARNKGIKEARGKIILMLGDDIYAESELLKEHLQFHTNHLKDNAACLGFVTWDPHQEVTPLMKFLETGRAILGRWGGGQFAYDLLETRKPDWHFFYTANISLKKNLLMREHFDESFKGYGWEDIDLGLRLTDKENLQLTYVAQARATHDHPYTLEAFMNREQSVGKALPLFQAKHPHHRLLPSPHKKTVFAVLGSAPVLALARIFWRNLYYYCLGKKYFLKGLREGILHAK